mgnify:CR=1 FL=1
MKNVSFVIPSHNCAAWLPHAVDSVLRQDYREVEAVIVDDASTDSTAEYLNWLRDPRVRVVRNPERLGRSASRNIGNESAEGDIICVLDADDLARPHRARMTAQKMGGAEDLLLFGSAAVIDAVGTLVGEHRAEPFRLERALAEGVNRIVHSTVAYSRALAARFPYESGDIADLGIDDWAQQLAAAQAGVRFDFIPGVVTDYRQLETGISAQRDEKKVQAAKAAFRARLAAPAGAAC